MNLKELIANLLATSPDSIDAGTSLASLRTSLGVARVGLGLKRLGMTLPGNTVPATFGELEAALTGSKPQAPAPPVPSTPHVVAAPQSGVQIGLDVQEVSALPAAADFWEHEFYRGTFGKNEIAYAVVQPEPRVHLAGFWCVKEALRKCDPSFAGADPAATTVAHDSTGRPYLMWQTTTGMVRLPHAVSISHSGATATAVVVAVAAGVVDSPSAPAEPVGSTPQFFAFLAVLLAVGYWLARQW